MTQQRHVTWENFERDVLIPGTPAKVPIAGAPPIFLTYTKNPVALGISVSLPAAIPSPHLNYSEVDVAIDSTPDGPFLSVLTKNEDLFRPFFFLALEIADAIQLENLKPIAAVTESVDRFASILRLKPGPSVEQMIGLWGELEVLEHLLRGSGIENLECWNGWRSDQHDFRIGSIELEVKTTLGAQSVHMINGLGQLRPSMGHELFLLSLQLARSAEGVSLRNRVEAIEQLLACDPSRLEDFRHAIADIGFDILMPAVATDRFLLRRDAWIVRAADEDVPRLIPETLVPGVSLSAMGRLIDVGYRINIEGLGHKPGTELFSRVLPWW